MTPREFVKRYSNRMSHASYFARDCSMLLMATFSEPVNKMVTVSMVVGRSPIFGLYRHGEKICVDLDYNSGTVEFYSVEDLLIWLESYLL